MAKQNIDIIGSTEKIDFPEFKLAQVPAKTDTGADSSAIWASNVQVTPVGLQFVLFGMGSQYYTGEPVVVTAYRTTSVKNSFGEAEFRYKVRLLLKVGGRSVRAWFTLSDRAGMRYPVLLGRRLLKNKFLVDVSQSQRGEGKAGRKRVLMVASSTVDLDVFAKEVATYMDTKADIVVRSFTDLLFDVQANKVAVRETVTGKDIADFDVVYFKSHKGNYEFAVAAAQYLAFRHVPFFDQELLHHVSYDKLSESLVLALQGVAVPRSICAGIDVLRAQEKDLTTKLGLPLVCKEVNADRGRKNFFVKSKKELDDILAHADKSDRFMVQQFIPNQGYLRLYVFGTDVGPAVQRAAIGHPDSRKAHLNNTTGGANAALLSNDKIPPAAYDVAMRASRLMNRQIAGVDVIQHQKTKKWYVLEVNNAPQIKTGTYLAEKRMALARFLDFELNR